MTDEEYRELIEQNIYGIDDYVYFLAHSRYKPVHHHMWLRVLCLMETWDMIQ